MRAMGIPTGLHAAIVTSGEATHVMLRDRVDPWFAALGPAVFHLGPERDRNLLDGLDLTLAAPAAADFVLNTGPDDHRDPTDMAPFEADLAACAARGLPMICANPDLEVIRGGRRIICAGALAVRYAELGGEVKSLGKPDPLIYRPILDLLGLPKDRVLAVGDSLRTDIAGAAAIGVDSCWVLGGIHGGIADPAGAASSLGLYPVAAIQRLNW
jgi:HAD superfamily hydrolase (TIGR01459 family)